jgi:hypothetical protein
MLLFFVFLLKKAEIEMYVFVAKYIHQFGLNNSENKSE